MSFNNVFVIAGIALALSSFAVAAQESKAEGCSGGAELAKLIMETRQKEFPMAALMDMAKTDLERGLIIKAYERRSYNSEEIAARMAAEFQNEFYLSCIKR